MKVKSFYIYLKKIGIIYFVVQMHANTRLSSCWLIVVGCWLHKLLIINSLTNIRTAII